MIPVSPCLVLCTELTEHEHSTLQTTAPRTSTRTQHTAHGARGVSRVCWPFVASVVPLWSLFTACHGMHQPRPQSSSGPRSANVGSSASPSKHQCVANRSGSARSSQRLASKATICAVGATPRERRLRKDRGWPTPSDVEWTAMDASSGNGNGRVWTKSRPTKETRTSARSAAAGVKRRLADDHRDQSGGGGERVGGAARGSQTVRSPDRCKVKDRKTKQSRGSPEGTLGARRSADPSSPSGE